MVADGKDGLIDLENLMRDIDSPVGNLATSPSPQSSAEESSKSSASDTQGRLSASRSATSNVAGGSESKPNPTQNPSKSKVVSDQSSTASAASTTQKTDSSNEKASLSEEELDSILVMESPELAAEVFAIREIAKTPLEGSSSSEDIDDVLKAERDPRLVMRVRRLWNVVFLKWLALIVNLRTLISRLFQDSKGLVREIAAKLKTSMRTWFFNRRAEFAIGWKWFSSRSAGQRISLILAGVIIGLTGLVVFQFSQGKLLPKTKREWIANFAELADGVFYYEASEPTEDFNDPVHHPEFVVTIERVVVNLRRSDEAADNSNPMAAFEFYVQADSQVGAIEVKDRSVEIRDQISRSIEQMTYPELSTDEGKTRLKLLLRKQINEIMSKGRVRRVYIKAIVLNPE
jgi:flagellar basal body-associated protein FliL